MLKVFPGTRPGTHSGRLRFLATFPGNPSGRAPGPFPHPPPLRVFRPVFLVFRRCSESVRRNAGVPKCSTFPCFLLLVRRGIPCSVARAHPRSVPSRRCSATPEVATPVALGREAAPLAGVQSTPLEVVSVDDDPDAGSLQLAPVVALGGLATPLVVEQRSLLEADERAGEIIVGAGSNTNGKIPLARATYADHLRRFGGVHRASEIWRQGCVRSVAADRGAVPEQAPSHRQPQMPVKVCSFSHKAKGE